MKGLYYKINLNLFISDKDMKEELLGLHQQGFMDAIGLGINNELREEFIIKLKETLNILKLK